MGMRRVRMGFAILLWWTAAPAAELDFQYAAIEQLPLMQEFEGEVEAVNRATLSAQTSGRIVEVLFDVDDYVERGAVLLRFRATEQEARLQQAQAGREEASARLREAQNERARIAGIYAKKLVAKAAMDKAEAELKAAKARLESADARLAEATEQFEHTVVKAPYSGIVVERHIEVGESANPGQALMTGLSLEHLRAVTVVPQRYIGAVRALSGGVVRSDATTVASESVTVSPYADPATHSFRVRLDLPAGDHGLYPGMLVKVGFELGKRDALLIPQQALVQRSEVSAVYVVDSDGVVSFRQIRPGQRTDDGRLEVLAGLEPGERVARNPIEASVRLKRQAMESAP